MKPQNLLPLLGLFSIESVLRRWLRVSLSAALVLMSILTMNLSHAQRNPRVEMDTSMGKITLELYPKAAPKTVENFLQYVNDKHYDGTIFHRVIDGFMIQGGGFNDKMVEKKTRPPIVHEGRAALEAGLKNKAGFVAMARTNDPQSATAQFYINVVDNAFLDPVALPKGDPIKEIKLGGQVFKNIPRAQALQIPELFGYTVFGKVVSGMDVVGKIKSVKTSNKAGHQNVPTDPVSIKSVRILK